MKYQTANTKAKEMTMTHEAKRTRAHRRASRHFAPFQRCREPRFDLARLAALIACLLFASSTFAGPAAATGGGDAREVSGRTLDVGGDAHVVDSAPSPGSPGAPIVVVTDADSPFDSLCGLAEAIRNANASLGQHPEPNCAAGTPGADEIWVDPAKHTYRFASPAATTANAFDVITQDLTIRPIPLTASPYKWIRLEADTGLSRFRFFEVGANTSLTVDGFELVGGKAFNTDWGGAIFGGAGSALTVRNSRVLHNSGFRGGAIGSDQGASVVIDATEVGYNGTSGPGGAIYVSDLAELHVINNSSIHSNESSTFGGGIAILNLNVGISVAISDSVVGSNRAMNHGGGLFGTFAGSSEVSLDRSAIVGNESGDTGGGLAIWGSSLNFDMRDSRVSENTANNTGGMVISPTNINAVVTRSEISSNTANSGVGGMHVRSQGQVDISTTTISDNSVTGSGGVTQSGGLQVEDVQDLAIGFTTIVGNSTASHWPGGLSAFSAQVSNISGSVISGNSNVPGITGLGQAELMVGHFDTIEYSVVGHAGGTTHANLGYFAVVSPSSINASSDAERVAVSDMFTTLDATAEDAPAHPKTHSFAVRDGAPIIGLVSPCPSAAEDQYGNQRGSQCDPGSREYLGQAAPSS